jgi:thioredoxin-like negative regulator of GroEL
MLSQITDVGYRDFIQRLPYAILVLDAPWNNGGLALKERVAEVGDKFVNVIAIGEVNVDNAPGIVNEMKVNSIPAIAFFRAGKMVTFFVGASQNISKQAESLIAGEQVKYIHVEDLTIQAPPHKRYWFNRLFSWLYPTSK